MKRREFAIRAGIWAGLKVSRAQTSSSGRRPFSDILVVLPGIMGSVLAKDGKDLWNPSFDAFFSAVVQPRRIPEELLLRHDSAEADDLGDGIQASRLLQDVHLVPGFWRIDGYTGITQRLQEAFALKPGDNYFEFAYDWRRDNRAHARRLKRLSDGWLKAWRERSGNSSAKLVLLAHSMGGLIARYFTECLDGWHNTKSLVTFGAPFRGSLNALNVLANGVNIAGTRLDAFSTIARTLTSIYQLLPQYACYDPGTGSLGRVGQTRGIPNVDYRRAAEALHFHLEMDEAAERNRKNDDYRRNYRLYPIVGTYQKTNQSARLAGGRVTFSQIYPGRNVEGDGTVPDVSAVPPEMTADDGVYVAQLHSSIQNTRSVLDHLIKLVSAENLSDLRGPGDRRASLEVADVHPAGAPIEIMAHASRDADQLAVRILEASSGRSLQAQAMVRQSDDSWHATIHPLPVGPYRVLIEGTALTNPLADVFAVLDLVGPH
jgi:hypothetical protein